MNTVRNGFGVWFAVQLVGATAAWALINPNFTPKNMVEESTVIAVLEISKGEKPNEFKAKVVNTRKGKLEKAAFTLDCGAAINEATAEFLVKHLNRAKGDTATFWIGEYSDPDAGGGLGGGEKDVAKAFLHTGSKWMDLEETAPGVWGLIQMNSALEATWAGGSDMLLRATDYVLGDEDAIIPVVAGAEWEEVVEVPSAPGDVVAMQPIDREGNGDVALFLASLAGDRIMAYDQKAKKLADVTAAAKLQSRSRLSVWCDFNNDGKLDLVSYDGKSLGFVAAGPDGAFLPAVACELGDFAAGPFLSLAAVDADRSGACGVLIGTAKVPLLLSGLASGKPKVAPIAAGDLPAQDLGTAAVCLAGDVDGDAIPDVVQVFEKGSLLYRGKKDGGFAAPEKTALWGGERLRKAVFADFDADGHLDIFVAGEPGVLIWQNDGKGNFKEFVHTSGEMAYISKPNAIDAHIADFNNDGRQDVLIGYSDMGAQIFFNRGFRSFGHAHDMDMSEKRLLEGALTGQKAVCAADLNGDGAPDMVVALPGGKMHVFYRAENENGLHVAVALARKSEFGGPLTVTARVGTQSLGAWNVTRSGTGAFFGMNQGGPMRLSWRLPSGKTETKEVVVENKPVRVVIR